MTNKEKTSMTLTPKVLDQARQEYDNVSGKVEELLKNDLASGNNERQLKRKLAKIEDELMDKKREIQRIERQREKLRSEKEIVINKLEKEENADEKDKSIEKAIEVIQRKHKNELNFNAEDIPSYWVEETGKEKEELFEIAMENNKA